MPACGAPAGNLFQPRELSNCPLTSASHRTPPSPADPKPRRTGPIAGQIHCLRLVDTPLAEVHKLSWTSQTLGFLEWLQQLQLPVAVPRQTARGVQRLCPTMLTCRSEE